MTQTFQSRLAEKRRAFRDVFLEVTELQVKGARQGASVLHLTDTHLSDCDSRNPDLVGAMAKWQQVFGGRMSQNVERLVRLANELEVGAVALTGDIVHCPTEANLDLGRKLFQQLKMPWGYALGNHDWTGAPPPDREHWRSKYSRWTDRPLSWHSLNLAGVDLVFIDNSDYQISPEQLQKTETLARAGNPCILFMHIPISLESLRPDALAVWKVPILMGDPTWTKEARKQWGNAETDAASTLEFIELVKNNPNLQAVFAGHLHFSHQDQYRPGHSQYVTDAGFKLSARLIEIQPA